MIAFHKVIEPFLDKDEKLILNTIKSEIKALPRKVIHFRYSLTTLLSF